MDREKNGSLSVPEAKERLREAAKRLSLAEWVRHDPKDAMATAFVAGFCSGREKNDSEGAAMLAAQLLKILD